jgi:hypothetical protein
MAESDMTATILHALEHNALGDAVREIPWLFSACEAVHFIGLSIMAGALIIIDLRLLGLLRQADHRTVEKLIPVAVVGFVLNLASGVTLFVSDPYMYWPNPVFKLKMAFVLLAGANALWFGLLTARKPIFRFTPERQRALMKATAYVSLISWFLVILAGRLLPTFEAY